MPKRGRPAKLFLPEMYEQAVSLLGLGFTEVDLGKFWCVSHDTILRWKKKHPGFSVAIDRGKVEADISITKALYNNAVSGNLSAQIFWLTNRRNDLWADKRAIVQNNIYNKAGANGTFTGEDREFSGNIMDTLRKKLEE